MTEVDQRIVAMHFDNKQFEKSARQTINTLEDLRDHLDLEGAAKGFTELSEKARDLNFSNTEKKASGFGKALSSIQNIAKKTFSSATFPLRSLGNEIHHLTNDVQRWIGIDLARTVEQAGLSFARSLTIDPLRTGWNEYEMKMDSIKTIMSGTAHEWGEMANSDLHLEAVKESLEELNHYADQTIYSFQDMTSNIGKFTNAGVSLDRAVPAMKGIANLAASAGQGALQASMAMYNFSQSLSLGYVELRDWRSIENANLATMEFKNTLIEVGLAMGTLKRDAKGTIKTAVKGQKAVEVTAENLRETLKNKWLSGDVLTRTLQVYSGEFTSIEDILAAGLISAKDEKGRAKSTEQMREEAEALLKIGQEAAKAATEVRTFSKMYDSLKEAAQSGWAEAWEFIIGDMHEATALWTDINNGISSILDAARDARNKALMFWRGQQKVDLTDDFGNVVKSVVVSANNTGFGSVDMREQLIMSLHELVMVFLDLGNAVTIAKERIFGSDLGKTLVNLTFGFSEFVYSVSDWLGVLHDWQKSDSDEVRDTLTVLEQWAAGTRIDKIVLVFQGLFSILKKIGKIVKSIATTIGNALLPLLDPILDFISLVSVAFIKWFEYSDFESFKELMLTAVVNLFTQLYAGFKIQFQKAGVWFLGLLKDFFHIETKIDPAQDFGAWAGEVLGGIYGQFKSKWEKFVRSIRHWFSDKWEEVLDFIIGPRTNSGKFHFAGPNAGKNVYDRDYTQAPIGRLILGIEQTVKDIQDSETFKSIKETIESIISSIRNFFVGEDAEEVFEAPNGRTYVQQSVHRKSGIEQFIDQITATFERLTKFFSTEEGGGLHGVMAEAKKWANAFKADFESIWATVEGVWYDLVGRDVEVDIGPGITENVHVEGQIELLIDSVNAWINEALAEDESENGDKKTQKTLLQGLFSKAVGVIASITESVNQFFSLDEGGVLGDAPATVNAWIEAARQGIKSIEDTINGFISTVFGSGEGEKPKETVTVTSPTQASTTTTAYLWAEALYNSSSAVVKLAIDSLTGMFGDQSKSPIQNIAELITSIDSWVTRAITDLTGIIETVRSRITRFFVGEDVEEIIVPPKGKTGIVGRRKVHHNGLFDNIAQTVRQSIQDGIDTIAGVWSSITGWFEDRKADVTATIEPIWNAIVGFFTGGSSDSEGATPSTSGESPFKRFFDWVGKGVEDAIKTVSKLWAKIFSWFEVRKAVVEGTLSSMWNSIVSFFTGGESSNERTDSPFAAFFNWIKDGVETAVTAVSSVWDTVVKWFEETSKSLDISGKVGAAWDTIKSFFTPNEGEVSDGSGTWGVITAWFNGLYGSIEEIADKIRNWDGWQVIREFFLGKDIMTKRDGMMHEDGPFVAFFKRLGSGLDEAWKSVSSSPIWTTISGFFSSAWDSIRDWFTVADEDTGLTGFGAFIASIEASFTKFGNWLETSDLGKAITSFFTTVWNVISEFFTKTDEVSGETPFQSFMNGLTGDLTQFVNDTTKMVTLDNLLKTVNDFWDRIISLFTPKEEDALSEDKNIGSAITNVVGQVDQSVKQSGSKLDSLVSTLTEVSGTFESTSGLIDTINSYLTTIQTTISEWHLDEQVQSIWNEIVKFIQDLVSDIQMKFATPADAKEVSTETENTTDVFKAIGEFFTNTWGEIKKFFDELRAWGSEAWSDISGKLTTIYDKVLKPVFDVFSSFTELAAKLLESATLNPDISLFAYTMIAAIFETLSTIKEVAKETNHFRFTNSIFFKILEAAASLWLLGDVVERLGKLAEADFWSGIGRLAGLMVLFAGFIFLVKVITKTVNDVKGAIADNQLTPGQNILQNLAQNLLKWAAIFFILKLAVPDIVKSMESLKDVDAGAVLNFGFTFSIIMASIIGLLLVLPKLKKAGGAIESIPTIAEVFVAAAAIFSLMAALGWFLTTDAASGVLGTGTTSTGMKMKSISDGVIALFEFLGRIAGAVAGGFNYQNAVSSANGMKEAADVINSIAGIALDEESKAGILNAMDFFAQIVDKIPSKSGNFMEFIYNLFGEGKLNPEELASYMKALGTGLREFFNATDEMFYEEGGKTYKRSAVDADTVKGRAEAVLALIDTFALFMQLDQYDNLTYGMGNGFGAKFIDWLTDMGKATRDLTPDQLSGVTGFFETFGSAVQSGLDGAAEVINTDKIREAIIMSINNDKASIAKAVQDAYQEAGTTIFNTGDAGNGKSWLTNLVDTGSAMSEYTSFMKGLTEGTENPFASIFGEGGSANLATTIFSGLDPKQYESLLQEKMGENGLMGELQKYVNGFNFNSEDGSLAFGDFQMNLTEGMMPDVSDFDIGGLINSLKNTINSNAWQFEECGKYINMGLRRGIIDYRSYSEGAMISLCRGLINTARAEFDQNSPSKVFEQIGMYNMLGLANGTEYYGSQAVSAAQNAGEQYLNEILSAMAPIDALMDDGTFQPVISPVIDMTNVRQGVNTMTGLFGGRYGLAPTMPGLTMGRSPMPEVRSSQDNYATFTQAVTGRLDELNERITNLQVVLDSGALVGQMGPAMDRYLGQQANRYRRAKL